MAKYSYNLFRVKYIRRLQDDINIGIKEPVTHEMVVSIVVGWNLLETEI